MKNEGIYLPFTIFLISFSLFNASRGVRLLTSKFRISSRIWITSIDIYPNLNYSDRLNVLDTSFFDNFIFSAEEVSGIEYVTNNDISVTAENGYIYIEGVKSMPVYLFSVDGKLLHFAENVNGSYSIPAENGVHLIKIGNTSYKIINF